MPTTAFLLAATGKEVDDATGTIGFTSPSNITNDGASISVVNFANSGEETEWLVAQDFSPSYDTDRALLSLTVQIRIQYNGTPSSVPTIHRIQLSKDGGTTFLTTQKASNDSIPDPWTVLTFTWDASDLSTDGVTTADVQASTFAVGFRFLSNETIAHDLFIDFVKVQFEYEDNEVQTALTFGSLGIAATAIQDNDAALSLAFGSLGIAATVSVPPLAPVEVWTLVRTSGSSATLTWTQPAGTNAADLYRYEVLGGQIDYSTEQLKSNRTSPESYGSLDPDTSYAFVLRSKDTTSGRSSRRTPVVYAPADSDILS